MSEVDTKIAKRILHDEAQDTIVRMKAQAPVKTGRLKQNIGFIPRGNDDIIFHSQAIDPDTGENYPPLQEFGTRFYPAQPYFYRNVRQFFSDVRARLGAELRKIINS